MDVESFCQKIISDLCQAFILKQAKRMAVKSFCQQIITNLSQVVIREQVIRRIVVTKMVLVCRTSCYIRLCVGCRNRQNKNREMTEISDWCVHQQLVIVEYMQRTKTLELYTCDTQIHCCHYIPIGWKKTIGSQCLSMHDIIHLAILLNLNIIFKPCDA